MARSFDGTNDALALSSAVLTAPPITLSAWVYPTSDPGDRHIIQIGTDGTYNYVFTLMVEVTSEYVLAIQRSTASSTARTTTTISTGQWSHVCAVFESNDYRYIYLNGGGKGSDTGTRPDFTPNKTSIGQRGDGAARFPGYIAEAAIFNAFLSDKEVADLAAGASPFLIRPGSLVAYWPIYGVTSPEPDATGNGNSMTLVGSPARLDLTPPTLRSIWTPPRRVLVGTAGEVPTVLAGVQASGAIGAMLTGTVVSISGHEATGAYGTMAQSAVQNITLEGEGASCCIGVLGLEIGASIAGHYATGQVGSVAASPAVILSGCEATGAVGALAPITGTVQSLTGHEATGAAGILLQAQVETLAGIAATGAVGSLTAVTPNEIPLTGYQASAVAGSMLITQAIPIDGVAASSAYGTLTPYVGSLVELAGLEATSAVGTMILSPSVVLTGLYATSAIGTLPISATALAVPPAISIRVQVPTSTTIRLDS